MFNFTRAIIRGSKSNSGAFSIARIINFSSAPTSIELKPSNTGEGVTGDAEPLGSPSKGPVNNKYIRSSNIVAAAFASLNSDTSYSDIQTPFTDNRIQQAGTIDELLSISSGAGVSRRHALKVVSVLADWSSTGKIKLSDFEADPRFIKLCKILTKGVYVSKSNNRENVVNRSEDLSTIMTVTADDEAAKLVASITLPQMVKVMQSLALKKRRSTMLLRSLAFNITRCTEKLDLKQSADLLYSMTVLNFQDENLLERIGNDVIASLNVPLKKSAVIGSIFTSLGLMRYKDEVGLLDTLCTWTLKNHDICRPQDIFALFQTLAVLNFEPSNAKALYDELIPQLSNSDVTKPTVWLDLVWSLLLLNLAKPEHISSVLSEKFVQVIELTVGTSCKLKLLNVNAAADVFLKTYNGPKLDRSSSIFKAPLARTKEKEEIVFSVLESLKSLMRSDKYIRANVNTEMGFYLDAECVLDKKCLPVALGDYKESPNLTKVAIMILDYHEMCRGRVEPTGMNIFATRLLEAKGYKILQIPYYEYKSRDKLIHRVQYLESKLKSLVQT